jgi:CelD/BcsL family acetyltransferase involved in cellulose biosynthesis
MPSVLTPNERAIWDQICRADPLLRTPFYTYTYARAVADVRPYAYVVVIEQDGRPVGFLPFQFAGISAKLLRAAQPIGDYMTDYFGIIAEPGLQLHPLQLLKISGICSLLFSHLDESQEIHGLTGEKPEPGLRVAMNAGVDAYWAALHNIDKHFISDTKRRERKLISRHGQLRFCFSSADPAPALAQLIEHKSQQYLRTGKTDLFSVEWTRRLLYKLSSSADPLCSGVLSTLYAGETWVASHFGLRSGNVFHHWFPVYNPELKDFSPGRLLFKEMINAANENGIDMIDFGAGDIPAKRDFANTHHNYYRGMWTRPTARALCFRLAMSVRWRLGRRLKPDPDPG